MLQFINEAVKQLFLRILFLCLSMSGADDMNSIFGDSIQDTYAQLAQLYHQYIVSFLFSFLVVFLFFCWCAERKDGSVCCDVFVYLCFVLFCFVVSGFKGENLSKPSDNMSWWKEFEVKIKKEKMKCVTLIDALEKIVHQPKRLSDKPSRMPESAVYRIRGVGHVITTRIEQGKIAPGVDVRFYPSAVKGEAFSVGMYHKNVTEAVCDDNVFVGVIVKGLTTDNMPRVGDVMCTDYPKTDPEPPKSAEKFTALIFVQEHPGQLKCSQADKKSGGYKGGFTASIHIRTAKASCQMVEIAWELGKSTNNPKVECPS